MRDWREMAPLPPQELPKRGDEWARSRTEVQFMKEGHVYFTDSVRPATHTDSCSYMSPSAALCSSCGDMEFLQLVGGNIHAVCISSGTIFEDFEMPHRPGHSGLMGLCFHY